MIEPYHRGGDPPRLGQRQFTLGPDRAFVESRVIFPLAFRDCVAYLYAENRKGERVPIGTAFGMFVPTLGPRIGARYLVTARHNIERIRLKARDRAAWVRVNRTGTGVDWYQFPLDMWRFHPGDDPNVTGDEWLHEPRDGMRYDVAVATCQRGFAGDESTLAFMTPDALVTDAYAREEMIQAGDDVLITGLYHQHVGQAKNIPIVRQGVIAAMPEEPVVSKLGFIHAYLIEARSTGGLSGSPVFWWTGYARPTDTPGEYRGLSKTSFRLLGMIHGHFESRIDAEWLNDGIAQVVPASVILETLHQEALVDERKPKIEGPYEVETRTDLDSTRSSDDEPADSLDSLAGADYEDVLRALLRTPPHGQNQDPA